MLEPFPDLRVPAGNGFEPPTALEPIHALSEVEPATCGCRISVERSQ